MKVKEEPLDDASLPTPPPVKGDESDPYIIVDNGNSPSSSSSVPTEDFPSLSRTPQEGRNVLSGESSTAVSPSHSQESFDSLNTMCRKVRESAGKVGENKG